MKILKKIKDGFTMIEIMVVVVIVAILAAIALPIYLDYVQSSYAAEARVTLKTIYSAAKMRYQTRGGYPSDIEQLEREGFMDLERSTKLKWQFELQMPDRVTATSTDDMQGGGGHRVSYDGQNGKFTGYGSAEGSE